jgi:hypothetical protein
MEIVPPPKVEPIPPSLSKEVVEMEIVPPSKPEPEPMLPVVKKVKKKRTPSPKRKEQSKELSL